MSFSKLLKIEQKMKQTLTTERKSIEETIKTTPIPDIKQINETCCIVSLGAIKNKPWGPENYNANTQATYVSDALSAMQTATSFASKINQMITEKSVTKGKTKNSLNETTISILEKWKNTNNA